MKKILCIVLFVLLLCDMLCACKKDVPEKEDVRKVMFSELDSFYSGKKPGSCAEAASLLAAGKDLTAADLSALFAEDVPDAEYVIAHSLLERAGIRTETGANAEERARRLAVSIADTESIPTVALYVTVLALELYGAEYDRASVAESLTARQDEISGGSYEYPQSAGSSARISAEDTAASLMTYMLIRGTVRTQVLEDTLHDSALVYLGNCIQNDNTVLNAEGVSSSVATARVLTALLVCGVPMDGEISTALLNAIRTFAVKNGGALIGYRDTADDDPKRSTAAEILFCVTAALYGNPYFAETQHPASGTVIN